MIEISPTGCHLGEPEKGKSMCVCIHVCACVCMCVCVCVTLSMTELKERKRELAVTPANNAKTTNRNNFHSNKKVEGVNIMVTSPSYVNSLSFQESTGAQTEAFKSTL